MLLACYSSLIKALLMLNEIDITSNRFKYKHVCCLDERDFSWKKGCMSIFIFVSSASIRPKRSRFTYIK